MSMVYMVIYMTCMFHLLSCTRLVFTILFNHIQHVYCVYGVPYMQVTAIRTNLFLQHMGLCCKIFHSLILHVLRCTINDHHYYHSSIVCESTSWDSTPTTLMGECVTLQSCIEYFVIANITPMGPEYPLLSYTIYIVAYRT